MERHSCPHCDALAESSDFYSGELAACPRCGHPIAARPQRPLMGMRRSTAIAVAAGLGAALVAVSVLAMFMLRRPEAKMAHDIERRADCAVNLERLAKAMRKYELANGHFPPAYVADQSGKPLYSWRVLLLPYLGQQALFDRFHTEEPWDSPANRAVSDLTIDLFQCPADSARDQPTTSYMMVVGPHTISNGGESRTIDEIRDGLVNTIMIVEVDDSTIRWAQPEDLRFDGINFTVNGRGRRGISSHHRGGANVAFCDGSVRMLKSSINPQLVKAMATIDGGEEMPEQ